MNFVLNQHSIATVVWLPTFLLFITTSLFLFRMRTITELYVSLSFLDLYISFKVLQIFKIDSVCVLSCVFVPTIDLACIY